MSEPEKTHKRSKRKPPMEPVGWDEIVSQPGMGGYLSFLNGPIALPHLQPQQTPEAVPTPEVDLSEPIENRVQNGSEPALIPTPVPTEPPPPPSAPVVKPVSLAPTPVVISIPAAVPGRVRIRKCLATHDGHSLGEEVLYQALWKAAQPESQASRTIVIGWRGMSQLCRMTPKNCKINTQRLIRKLALDVLSPYNTPESIGTTYRVYSDETILQRRRATGLEWVIRSRGVEFVDPATGQSIIA